MNNQHPITPPPELVWKWSDESPEHQIADHVEWLATRAAQWGADQELEACCLFFQSDLLSEGRTVERLRAARRPKSPNLKEQALEDLEILIADLANHGMGFKATTIRRALEQLPE